jgi:hypothetical protein
MGVIFPVTVVKQSSLLLLRGLQFFILNAVFADEEAFSLSAVPRRQFFAQPWFN